MSDIRLNISDVDFAHDDETREARHELLASFLGAYVDNELPPETRSQIDAHLTGCARCGRELEVHRALKDRLSNEPVPAASAALRNRIAAGIKSAQPPVFAPEATVEPAPAKRVAARTRLAIGALLVASSVAVFAISQSRATQSVGVAHVVTAASVPLFSDVLADYRRVMAGNLPGRAPDLEAVRAAVPFAFAPLSNSSLRLLGTWTTSIAGEPAVVIEYRFNNLIVLQYLVTDQLLFQSAEVRTALAEQKSASVTDRGQGMLVWAEPEYGSILLGDFAPEQLATLRDTNTKR